MVTSELKDGIVWLTIEEKMVLEDFSGFITDLRPMTIIPSMVEQKEMEEWRKKNKSGKPHAILGQTNALGALIQIFIRLTRAKDTRYFMNPEAAIAWVKSFDQ
jgi:hypothetical protein